MANHNLQRKGTFNRNTPLTLVRLGIAGLALMMALPLHAADNRPVKWRVAPSYPEMAKRMRISGVVKVSATVAPDGSVTAVKTVTGNSMLSRAAEDAVSKWKFVPAAEQSTVEIDINFGVS